MPESNHIQPEAVRKLAAIMFTDIAGYTTLMGQEEKRALRAMEKNIAIRKSLVEEYQGIWHKDLGDGSLCSLSSTVNALMGE